MPRTPRTAGTTSGLSFRRHGVSTPAEVEIGSTFRAGPKTGAVAGRIVTVVGVSCEHVSEADVEAAEDQDDFGARRGWQAIVYVRFATDAEAAPILAADATKAQVATDADAARVLAETVRAAATAGLTRTSLGHELIRTATAREDVVRWESPTPRTTGLRDWWSLVRITTPTGGYLVQDGSTGSDMDPGPQLWLAAADLDRLAREWAASCQITVAAAREHCEEHDDCWRERYYTVMLEDAGVAIPAYDPQASGRRYARERAERDALDEESRDEDRWVTAQLEASRRRQVVEDSARAVIEAARRGLSDAQLEALHAIEACGRGGVRVVGSVQRASSLEIEAGASPKVRELERAVTVDPADEAAWARLDNERARRGARVVVARSATIRALVDAGLVSLAGDVATAIRAMGVA